MHTLTIIANGQPGVAGQGEVYLDGILLRGMRRADLSLTLEERPRVVLDLEVALSTAPPAPVKRVVDVECRIDAKAAEELEKLRRFYHEIVRATGDDCILDRWKRAEEDCAEAKQNYENACKTIAAMHEAATGQKGSSPRRGVVEDVADLRKRCLSHEDGLEAAWGIIANVSGGDWNRENPQWKKCAERWRDEYFRPVAAARMEAVVAVARKAAAKSYTLHYWVAHPDRVTALAIEKGGLSGQGTLLFWRGRVMVEDRRENPANQPRLCVGEHVPGEGVERVEATLYWLMHSAVVRALKIPHVNGEILVWKGLRVWTDDRAPTTNPILCIWPPGPDGLHAFVDPFEANR